MIVITAAKRPGRRGITAARRPARRASITVTTITRVEAARRAAPVMAITVRRAVLFTTAVRRVVEAKNVLKLTLTSTVQKH